MLEGDHLIGIGIIACIALSIVFSYMDNMWGAYQRRKAEEARIAAQYKAQEKKAQQTREVSRE